MVTTAMDLLLLCGHTAVRAPLSQDAPAVVPGRVFSCRSRRVPVALTPARGPTLARIWRPGLRADAHGWSAPGGGTVVVSLRAKSVRTCRTAPSRLVHRGAGVESAGLHPQPGVE